MAIATVRLEAWSDLGRTEFKVEFDPTAVTALPTDSGCVIQIPLSVAPDWLGSTHPCLIAVHGTLKLDASSLTGVDIPMQSLLPNYKTLRVPVSAADLVRIEARRRGAVQLVGHLSLAGIANIAFKPHHDYQGANQAVVTAAVHDSGGTPFVIEREQWLRLLAQAGHEWTRLVELPALAGPTEGEWQACVGLLAQATTEFRSGVSEPAIATCRKVLEGLVIVVAKHWSVQRGQGQSMEGWLKELQARLATAWPDDDEAARVLTGLYAAVWSWTSESHHYRSKVPLHEEAAFAIGLTSELLVHAGHLLAAHPEPLKPAAGQD